MIHLTIVSLLSDKEELLLVRQFIAAFEEKYSDKNPVVFCQPGINPEIFFTTFLPKVELVRELAFDYFAGSSASNFLGVVMNRMNQGKKDFVVLATPKQAQLFLHSVRMRFQNLVFETRHEKPAVFVTITE